MAKVRIVQRRSVIGRPQDQRRTVRALGLRKIGDEVLHEDTPTIRGMAFKVRHIVELAPAEEGSS